MFNVAMAYYGWLRYQNLLVSVYCLPAEPLSVENYKYIFRPAGFNEYRALKNCFVFRYLIRLKNSL